MPLTGFEPAVPASELLQTHALERTATRFGDMCVYIQRHRLSGDMCVYIQRHRLSGDMCVYIQRHRLSN